MRERVCSVRESRLSQGGRRLKENRLKIEVAFFRSPPPTKAAYLDSHGRLAGPCVPREYLCWRNERAGASRGGGGAPPDEEIAVLPPPPLMLLRQFDIAVVASPLVVVCS